ncbi:GNAT family N-acetyltransferase [Arcanobacterium ihumii]|uniref:GNAT family N-acetyltransferase n=1 Tax=Arcanobacterium ihumii TaxID=2138162 RepID=UPI00135C74A3|nr:GNAT family N-acetyltransferase [Arcanobacterium ihumii]
MVLPLKTKLCTVPASWSRRCADFDVQNFARDAWSLPIWEQELLANDREYLAVVADPEPHQSLGRVVALAGISFGPDAELLTIAVDADFRRLGIARHLIATLLEHTKERGAERVFLEVRKADAGAQVLYEGFGFESIALRKKYYSDDDAVVMRLEF